MAVDSIMASPTNRVRVIVAEASGCCASAVSAVATARPSASAGPMVPNPVVMPAMTIDATATMVRMSMLFPLRRVAVVSCLGGFGGLFNGSRFAGARRRRDIHPGQDAENVGLHHAGQQPQEGHHNRKQEG